jgi:L-lactate dehydrogenase complex protein LldG
MSTNEPTQADGHGTERFVDEVERYGVSVTEVDLGDVSETLAGIVDPPAVGVEPSWEGVSLPDHVTRDPTPAELSEATQGVTEASLGVASYGSLALREDERASEPVSLFVDHHVALLHEDDIVPDMAGAFERLGQEARGTRESFILATGPSATADMGALVQGAHGPKEVDVVIIS